MKKLLTVLLLMSSTSTFCQKVKNYSNQSNDRGSYVTDYLQISVMSYDSPVSLSKAASVIPGLIGAVATVGIDIFEAEHDKKVATYSATTTNSASFSLKQGDVDDLNDGKKYLEIKRYGLNKLSDKLDEKNLVEQYDVDIIPIKGALQYKLKQYKLIYSKAFVKGDEYLAIGIDIKLGVGANAGSSNDTTAKVKTGTKPKPATTSATVNNLEGVIKIPLTQTVDIETNIVNVEKNSLINPVVFPVLTSSTNENPTVITFTVTVTEANISRLSNSVVDNLFKNKSSDFISLLKAAFPSSSGSSK